MTLDDGTEVEIGYDVNNIDVARQLLAESDYAGETTVVLNPTDYGTITPLGPVLIQDMQEIGFVVEMPAYDWATITTMFSNTGSYSANTNWYSHWCCGNPAQDHFLSGTYDYIIRDEGLTSLQLAWSTETDETNGSRSLKRSTGCAAESYGPDAGCLVPPHAGEGRPAVLRSEVRPILWQHLVEELMANT